jgi:CheY-like chemotaxis protein
VRRLGHVCGRLHGRVTNAVHVPRRDDELQLPVGSSIARDLRWHGTLRDCFGSLSLGAPGEIQTSRLSVGPCGEHPRRQVVQIPQVEVDHAPLFRTVLIADHDKGSREDLAWSLRVHGYRVLDAGTTLEALTVLSLNNVDLLVVGIGPRFDGRTAIDALSGDPRYATLPILVITSRPELVSNVRVLKPPIAHGVFAATVSSMIGPARTRPLTPIPGEVLIQTLLDGAGDDDVGGPDRGS